MIRCTEPRCCECARPLALREPFVAGVPQQQRCPGCGQYLLVRRETQAQWSVRTVAEHGGRRTAPLPAVASPTLRHRFLDACRSVALRLGGPGVEPGMAGVHEAPRHE